MSTSINLQILDRFRHVERMIRVAAVPCAGSMPTGESNDLLQDDKQGSEKGKVNTIPGILKRDAVLPFLLCKKEGAKQKEIADEIRVSPSTLSEMINRLVEDGYVDRKPCGGDRRVKTLVLTQKGRERAEYMLLQITQVVDSLFVNLDISEKEELIRLLDKMVGSDSTGIHKGDRV